VIKENSLAIFKDKRHYETTIRLLKERNAARIEKKEMTLNMSSHRMSAMIQSLPDAEECEKVTSLSLSYLCYSTLLRSDPSV